MNVTNRKMFRSRNARNKLNQMGGIMASSPELMGTVQRYQQGGPVDPALARRQQVNDPRTINRFMANLANLPAAAYDTAVGLPAAAMQNLGTAIQYSALGRQLGLSERGTEPEFVGAQPAQSQIRDFIGANQPLSQEIADVMAFQGIDDPKTAAEFLESTKNPTLRGPTASMIRGSMEADRATSDQISEELVGDMKPPTDEPFMMPGVTPSPQRDAAPEVPEEPATQDVDAAAPKAEGELAEEMDRVVNKAQPQEQKAELQRLMAEFTDAAPEYEGMNKGLALAKMGFAMAAGRSPDALQNIASAMEQSADMFIKDSQQRNKFERQLQLSALQYGLGEVGKQRAEERANEKEGRKLTYWVAEKNGEFNGKTFKKGDNVAVPVSFIRENGVPSSLTTPTLAKAAIETAADINEALLEAQKDNRLKASDYRAYSETMDEAAQNFASKQTLEQLLTKQVLNVSEGKITGIQPAFQDVVNKSASAVGVNLNKEYENLEQYDADMRRVANQMVNELLGEGSKTLSDFDRQLAQEIVGYYSGQGGYVFRDPDVLLGRLQNTLSDVQRAQQRSLNTMRDITDATAGLTLQSGRPVQFRSALSVAAPYLSESQAQNFNLVKGEDNVFRLSP